MLALTSGRPCEFLPKAIVDYGHLGPIWECVLHQSTGLCPAGVDTPRIPSLLGVIIPKKASFAELLHLHSSVNDLGTAPEMNK